MASRPSRAPLSARTLAAGVVGRVVREGAYVSLALGSALSRTGLSPSDKGFATELVYGTLRHLHALDDAIQQAANRPLKKLDEPTLDLLRIAAYEALRLGTPDHALVNEAVNHAKRIRGEPGGRFVNGVLRGMLRLRDSGALLPSSEKGVPGLVARYGLPTWLAHDVLTRLGPDEAEKFGAASLAKQAVHLCVPGGATARDDVLQQLKQAGVEAAAHPLTETGVVLQGSPGAIEELAVVQEGRAMVQNAASQVVAGWALQVAQRRENARVLDMCAAPGGKSAILLARGQRVISGDIHVDKLHLAQRQWKRQGLHALAVSQDAAQPPFVEACADVILLDAPCTGTGLLARRPEIRLRRQEADVQRLVELQARLLEASARLLKPGGTLIYSVCSVSTAEGPAQVKSFLSAHPGFALGTPPGTPADTLEDGMLALWPHRHDVDGFFAARLDKRG
ncbi:MAG: 16S rRNA (cytosine(967)-C(5))-methyltransferase RsmB [Myxococcota bacterium]